MRATVIDHRTDIAVLHLLGELDAATADTLRDALDDLVSRPQPRIVVDLSELRFCDSMGLSAFIGAYLAAEDAGGWLRLAGANAFIRKLVETVGLTRYVALYDDVTTAMAA
jgi:anti-anti-sigma factor